MPKLYLMTDEHDYSHGYRYWFPGAVHSTSGQGGLFGPGWILCFRNPILAAFLAPTHDPYEHPRLWLGEGDIGICDHGLAIGSQKLTAIKRVRLPELSSDQRIHLAIMASRKVYQEESYVEWTDRWLDGKRRRDDLDTSMGADDGKSKIVKVPRADWDEPNTSAKEAAFYTSAAVLSSRQAVSVVPNLCARAVSQAAAVKQIDVIGLAHQAFESA